MWQYMLVRLWVLLNRRDNNEKNNFYMVVRLHNYLYSITDRFCVLDRGTFFY